MSSILRKPFLTYLMFLDIFIMICAYGIQSSSASMASRTVIDEENEENADSAPCDPPSVMPMSIAQKLEDEMESLEQDSDCRDCTRRKANLTREELTQLRYEVVKHQILQKLHLTSPPCPKPPKPSLHMLLQAAEMMAEDGDSENVFDGRNEVDGKAKSALIYPLNESPPCIDAMDRPCMRFRFELSTDIGLSMPSSAELWLHKKKFTHVLMVSEIIYDQNSSLFVSTRNLVLGKNDLMSRLVKFRLPPDIHWLQSGDFWILDIQVSCYSACDSSTDSNIISESEEEKPFLLVHFQLGLSSPRNRRSVDCVENSLYCCRESLYISFAEIGWDDWILAPTGYEANFCKGKCRHDVSSTRFQHSSVLHRYIHTNSETAEEIGLKMCCTPSRMSNLSILYNNNGTIVKSTLLNMKVESCDCA